MPEQQIRLLAERYELIAPLGRGTMGTVWRARDRALGREVAVKEIRQDPGLTEEQRAELRERMVREGRIASRINHPSVAAIHDVLIDDGSPWIIMELIEARSLEQVIEEEGPLPPRLVAEIGVDLLGALRAAHAQGITHRDVKPGNVLITESGRVVLTDFGIAKAEGDSRLTKTGMVIGSPGYTAPERARGEYTGPESDIWSLGATLYFAVEGRPAYERSTIAETLAALLTESADPPTQAGQLRPVLNGLLNKDYRQRLNAAKAETMLRMVADTPTSEMPVLTAEALMAQEAALPDPFASPNQTPAPAAPRGPATGPQGPVPAAGDPRSPRSAPPGPKAPTVQHSAGQDRPPQAGTPGAQRTPGVRETPGTPGSRETPGAPGSRETAGTPGAREMPGAPGAGVPGRSGGEAAQGPGRAPAPSPASAPAPASASAEDGFDPDRTISVARPKGSFPAPPRQPQPPQQPADEGAINTMRIQSPIGSPGQQVYPPATSGPGRQQDTAPHQAPPPLPPQPQPQSQSQSRPQSQPQPQGLQQGPHQPPGPAPQQGVPQVPFEGQGLGTDLFSIVGPEEKPAGNRNGMLVLMAVAAAAAVVIAVLIVALFSS
ncbi:protein kinase [Nonomuraea sp. NPDC050783]|uniref:serine/threonine-protein kinase n=1 Tax=Nonomuraea sp. NPDC050783 TaxID=3154634 RepID=UPI003465C1F3